MLEIRNLDEAIDAYEWVAGEPIEERTITFLRVPSVIEPDSIYTV